MNNDNVTVEEPHFTEGNDLPPKITANDLTQTINISSLATFLDNAFGKLNLNTPEHPYTQQTLVKSNKKPPITNNFLHNINGEYILSKGNTSSANAQQMLQVNLPLAIIPVATTWVDIKLSLRSSHIEQPITECDDLLQILATGYYYKPDDIMIYDINGQQHILNFYFRKIESKNWRVYTTIDGIDVTPAMSSDGTNTKAYEFKFDENGFYIGLNNSFKIKFKPSDDLPIQEININHDFTQVKKEYFSGSISQNGRPQNSFLKINIAGIGQDGGDDAESTIFEAYYVDKKNINSHLKPEMFAIKLGTLQEYMLSHIIEAGADGQGHIRFKLPSNSRGILEDIEIITTSQEHQNADNNIVTIDFPLATAPIATTSIMYGFNLNNKSITPKVPFTINHAETYRLLVDTACYNSCVDHFIYNSSGVKYSTATYFVKTSIPRIWHMNLVINNEKVVFNQRFTLVFDGNGRLIKNDIKNPAKDYGNTKPTSTGLVANKDSLQKLFYGDLIINGQIINANIDTDYYSYSDELLSALNIANAINYTCKDKLNISATANQTTFDLGLVNSNINPIVLNQGDLLVNGVAIIGVYDDINLLIQTINENHLIPNINAKICNNSFILYNNTKQSNGMNIVVETNGKIIVNEVLYGSPLQRHTTKLVARGTITLNPRIISEAQEYEAVIIGGNNPGAVGFTAGIQCGVMHTNSDHIEICLTNEIKPQHIKINLNAKVTSSEYVFYATQDGAPESKLNGISMYRDGTVVVKYDKIDMLLIGKMKVEKNQLYLYKHNFSDIDLDCAGRVLTYCLTNRPMQLAQGYISKIQTFRKEHPDFFENNDIVIFFAIMAALSTSSSLDRFNQRYKLYHDKFLSDLIDIEQTDFIPLHKLEYLAFKGLHQDYTCKFFIQTQPTTLLLQNIIDDYYRCLMPVELWEHAMVFRNTLQDISCKQYHLKNPEHTSQNLTATTSTEKTSLINSI